MSSVSVRNNNRLFVLCAAAALMAVLCIALFAPMTAHAAPPDPINVVLVVTKPVTGTATLDGFPVLDGNGDPMVDVPFAKDDVISLMDASEVAIDLDTADAMAMYVNGVYQGLLGKGGTIVSAGDPATINGIKVSDAPKGAFKAKIWLTADQAITLTVDGIPQIYNMALVKNATFKSGTQIMVNVQKTLEVAAKTDASKVSVQIDGMPAVVLGAATKPATRTWTLGAQAPGMIYDSATKTNAMLRVISPTAPMPKIKGGGGGGSGSGFNW